MSGRAQLGRGEKSLVVLAVMALLAAGAGGAVLLEREHSRAPANQDFVAIEAVPWQPPPPAPRVSGSTGSFVSRCGNNENAHHNRDNVVVSPGEVGGAHHVHEYVGNVSTDAFSTDHSLAAADTTCRNGDASTYYWPVLRVLTRGHETDASEFMGWHGGHHNEGIRLAPASVLVQFRGNPVSRVVAMPRFLRLSTGQANAVTNPLPAGGTAQWGCTGFPTRRTRLYPLCPPGQQVVRIYDFPSCWDGRRSDSPNHVAHAVFPAPNAACPANTFPIPQLRVEVAYQVPPGRSYAIDTFPDERRSPTTDHAHFINVMPERLMARVVACVNTGKRC